MGRLGDPHRRPAASRAIDQVEDLDAAAGQPRRDERAHVGAGDRERQREQAGHLHQHGALAEALLLDLDLQRSAPVAGRARTPRPRAASPAGPRAVSAPSSQPRVVRGDQADQLVGEDRLGAARELEARAAPRSGRAASAGSRTGRARTSSGSSASVHPGACSAKSRVSGSESTVMAYSDMLTVEPLRARSPGRSRAGCRAAPRRPRPPRRPTGRSSSASGVSSNPRPDAHQQLVVEVLAQPRQRPAHRRLAHRHPLAGVREVALLEQRVQGQQQVGVDARAAAPSHAATSRRVTATT